MWHGLQFIILGNILFLYYIKCNKIIKQKYEAVFILIHSLEIFLGKFYIMEIVFFFAYWENT